MADLSSILALGNQQAAAQANAAVPPPDEHSDLRAGALNYRASLNNAAALAAENLGWDTTSARLRDEAARGTAEAERTMTPRVQTTDATGPIDAWKKNETGRYLSDIVHNIPSTLAQSVPAMAAPVTAGLAATALGGPLAGLAAGSAAMLPQTSGDIAARQYANKDNTDSAGVRGLKALGIGGASAVAQNVVPAWMGGKLVGGMAERGVAGAVTNKIAATAAATPVRPTIAGSIARNLSEAVGGNAAAGAAGEALTQYGAGEVIDPNKIAQAGVESGIVGAPFAALGVGGELAGRGPHPGARALDPRGYTPEELGTAAPPPAPAGEPGRTAPLDPNSPTGGGMSFDMPANADLPPGMRPQGPPAPGGAPDTPAGRKAARDAAAAAEAAKQPPADTQTAPTPEKGSGAPVQDSMDRAMAGKSVADRLAAGEPLVDNLGDFASAAGEKAQQMFDKGRKTASEWVQKTAQEYVKRRDLSPEQRATAERAAANPDDPTTHQAFGAMVNEMKAKDSDFEVLDALDKDFPEKKGPKGSKQSAGTAGIDTRIAQIAEPYMQGKHPEVQQRAAAVLRRLVASAGDEHGTMNEPAARRLLQLLGPQAHEMVQRVYDAVAPKDAVADARMARHVNYMQKVGERESGLGKVINDALPEDHNINVTHLKDALTRWARGDDEVGADARGRLHHAAMRQQIESMFGPKADKVFDALEEYVKREDDKPGSTTRVKQDKEALDRGDQGARRGDIAQEAGAEFGELDEGAMDPVYYGGGSNPLAMNELIEAPDVYRAKHDREGPAERMIKKLSGNDDLPEDLGGSGQRNIRWISEQEYNRRHGIRGTDETGAPTKEVPGSTTHGYIVHEEANDPAKFNDNDMRATRLDTKKYARSPSRITVDSLIKAEKDSEGNTVKPERKALNIDAVRLTERFLRNQETGTGDTNVVRNGKAFMDGIMALKDRLGDREFIDEEGLAKMGLKAGDDLEEHGLVLLPDALKIDKLGNTYGDMKRAFAQLGAKGIEADKRALRLFPNEEAKLRELRDGFKEASKGEQALRRQEAESIYAEAKQRNKDFELSGDQENDLTRRRTLVKNAGVAGVEGVTKKTERSTEGDVIKGRDKNGNPIFDLSARTQADAWFDEDGMVKAQHAINQLGDVHGGIDTGKVQQRDRDSYAQRVRDKAKAEGRALTKDEQARIDRMETRNEARTPSDARTGKGDTAFDSSGSGRTEIAPDENPHLAQAVAGMDTENIGRDLNMDDSRQSIDFGKAFKNEEEKRQLMNAASVMSQAGAAGRKIGRRMFALIDAADSMAEKDVNRLKRAGTQLNAGNLTPAEASTLVNELSRKYSATIIDREATRKGELNPAATKSDSAGAPTKPVATRPVPPEPEMTKRGNKPLENYNKGKPSAMLKEALGTHVPELINTVERIQQALKAGDSTEVDMKSPKGRKAVKDFLAANKEYEVTYNAEGDPVLTRAEGPQRPKAEAAQRAALDQAVSSSDPALIRELRTTDDLHGLQRTVDHLVETAPDSAALRAANRRMSEMSLDDDLAYQATLKSKQSAARATGSAGVSAAKRQHIRDHIEKVLGPKVLVAFKRMAHEGDFTPLANTPRGVADLIRISVHSMDPMSTAYHESLHGLVNNLRKAGLHEMVSVLQKAADSTYVRQQMEKLVGKDPAVMKQLRGADPEERIAYMYQLWANGQLKLDAKPEGFVAKISRMLREVLGVWSNDERATHIMKYFTEGEYARDMHDSDLVMAKTMDVAHGKNIRNIRNLTRPFTNMSDTVFAAGGQRIRDLENPALDRMVDLIKRKAGDTKSSDEGYIAAARLAKTQYMNKIGAVLEGLNETQRAEALENLQTAVPAGSPEARIAARETRKFLQEMHKYITDAGVQIGNLNSDYFPRVWDAHYISKNQHAFRGMLDKYVQRGDLTNAEADDFTRKIMTTGGNEFDVNTLRPGFQANKERVYAFIEHEDAARFQTKDLFRTVNDYVTQATRRAEWTRRFSGEDSLENIFDKARAQGATDAHIAQAERYLQGITGVLGDSMNPTLRRLQGNMMVYQNIRLLPLAIFSSIVDPMGLMVRGGSVGEAFKAFTYGLKEIPNNLRNVPKADMHAELAETMGVIDNAVLSATLGEAYQQGMVGETGRKINDKFFKYNLMEGWNRSMRIAATHTAMNFIAKHADGTYSKHSARFLDEMGLTPADIHRKADGTIRMHEGDGLTAAQAHKMRVAVNQWVDSAILRPDAADKPVWANDPRFALVAHLKQFVYSFQSTIIDRTMHEAKQGNYSPALALASYVPVMIAADALKGLLTTGGVPSRKENWDAWDYAKDGYARAGLMGVGQYRHDIVHDWAQGKSGLGAVQGPTLDQLSGAVEALRGVKSWGSFALDSMPANKLYNSH